MNIRFHNRVLPILSTFTLLLIAACDSPPVTPTPTRTLTGPTIAPTAIFYPVMPTIEPFSAGSNDPTAAGQPSGAEMPPLVIATSNSTTQTIQLTAGDGTQLNGDLYPNLAGTRAPAIVLLAPNRTAWGDFALQINSSGYTVLSMDVREGAPLGDGIAILEGLMSAPTVDPAKIAVVGAETGADLALAACASDLLCDALAMVTPLDAGGVSSLAAFLPRPLWIAVAQDDPARAISEQFRQNSPDGVQLVTEPGSLRGASLVATDSTLANALITFLSASLGAAQNGG